MRLFVSAVPDRRAVDHLADALAPLRADATAARWTDPARWHLTLDFLGEVAEERLAEAERRLAQVARRHAPIGPLRLAGCGHFGRRTLWIGVADADAATVPAPTDALRDLARDLHHRLARVAGDPPPRHWRAHLTIGRLRPPGGIIGRDVPPGGSIGRDVPPGGIIGRDVRPGGDPAGVVAALADYRGPAWTVGEISLVRSHLGPRPRHVPILTLPLSAPGPESPGA